MNDLTEIRPKLQHNSLFLPTENGLFVTGEGPGFHIKGKSIARWIALLAPRLTGEYTLDQLCARLDPPQREHVRRIIEMLIQKGVAKNHRLEPHGILTQEECRQFRPQIEYIDHFTEEAQRHFKQFRESSILLYGSGETLRALALFLIRNGLRTVSLVTSEREDEYLTALEPAVNAVRREGCEVNFSVLPNVIPAALTAPGACDMVVYCADRGSLKDISTLNQRCVAEGTAFLATTPFNAQIMLGPLVRPTQTPCWLCAMMRLAANSDEHAQATLWRDIALGTTDSGQEDALFLPVARRIGHGLGFELFKCLSACLPSEVEHGVVFQHLDTLESSRSPLVRHPLCPVCSHRDAATAAGQLDMIVRGDRDHEQPDTEIYERHLHLIDAQTGVFARFVDEDVEQIPLKRSCILGSAPDSLAADRLKVGAWSLDTTFSARVLALKEAIAHYSRRLPDTRGMIAASPREMRKQGYTIIEPQALSTWSGMLTSHEETTLFWTPAFSLNRNSRVYVAAAALYPSSFLNQSGIFEQTTAGTAVGTTFDQMLSQGILSALAYDYRCAFLHRRGTALDIELEALERTDPDLHFLLKSVRRFSRPFALKEIVADLPLVGVIAHTTDKRPICALGLELSGAASVKAALQRLLEGLLIQETGDELPLTGEKGFLLPSANLAAGRLHEPAMEMGQVKKALQQAGRDILFAHTTSADLWEQGTLMSGTVLLTRPLTRFEREKEA